MSPRRCCLRWVSGDDCSWGNGGDYSWQTSSGKLDHGRGEVSAEVLGGGGSTWLLGEPQARGSVWGRRYRGLGSDEQRRPHDRVHACLRKEDDTEERRTSRSTARYP